MWLQKIKRKISHVLLRPIRVLVFHQVSNSFDRDVMWSCDWNEITSFKNSILSLKSEYHFISLEEAHKHILHDVVRKEHFVVLTADDGYASLKNILPWLAENRIPITLFLNPGYLFNNETPGKGKESLLSKGELEKLIEQCSPYVSVASHGWTHKFCTQMSKEEFEKQANRSIQYMSSRKEYIPFYAYPCGKHTDWQDRFLIEHNIIPVYCDGMVNYNDPSRIHRECIDEGYLE